MTLQAPISRTIALGGSRNQDSRKNERRRHERYEVIAQVELSASDDVVFLQMENLSRGGALLSLTANEAPAFSVGQEVSTFLDLGSDEAGENLSVSLDGSIVRLIEHGPRDNPAVAVVWNRLSAHAEAGLAKILQYVARARPATAPT